MRALFAANKGVLCSRMTATNCSAPNSGIFEALAALRLAELAGAMGGDVLA
jgi:hypothetical protein